MTLHLDLSDSVVAGMKIPPSELAARLMSELAISLYSQDIVSFGKAVEMSGLPRHEFAHLLSQRGVPRHYSEGDLEHDLAYACRQ